METLTVTVPEAARMLGISERHAWNLVQVGELPVTRLGRRVLVSREGLTRMLAQAGV